MKYDENLLYNIKSKYNGTRYVLFDLAIWKNGRAFKKNDFSETGKPIIKIAELNNGINVNTAYTQGDYGDEVYIKPGDLLFSWSGNPKTSIDVFRYGMQDGWLNQHIFKITAKEEIVIKDYLYYILKYLKPRFMQIASNKQTTGLGHVTVADLKRINLVLPSKELQAQMVAILKVLDEKIENNNKINNNLLEQALTMYATQFATLDRNGCIGDYCSVKSGFAFKSSWWTTAGVKVIKIGSINQDNLNLLECSYVDADKIDKAKDFKVNAGDLLIAMTGATIGKFAMVPYSSELLLVNQRVGKFFLGSKPVEKLPFIYCTLKQPEVYGEVVNRGQGSAQPNISASDIMSIPCVIPSQVAINDFNGTAQPLFDLIISNQRENQQLSEVRDTLLPKLMSGELDVSDIKI